MIKRTLVKFAAFLLKPRHLAVHHAAYIGLGLIAINFTTLLSWRLYPYRPFEIKSLRIESPVVYAGGSIEYTMTYCKPDKYANYVADNQIAFVDHIVFNLPITAGPLPAACHSRTFWMEMPPIPPGKYHMTMERLYRVNPIRTVVAAAESNEFEVKVPSIEEGSPVTVLRPARRKPAKSTQPRTAYFYR